ncbi:MAG: hypothetical protein LLF89_11105, partial [Spirochaetaceae bacterium]|nr:hypothetical protein [Spirochaetaceae bacterium]
MERRSSFHPLPPPERIVPHVANKPFDIRLMPLLVLALGALFLPGRLSAQPDIPPILSFSPASTRESLVAAAKSHIGTPY